MMATTKTTTKHATSDSWSSLNVGLVGVTLE